MISAIKKIYSLSPCGTHTKLRTAFQFSLSSPVCKGQTWYLLTNSWIIVLRSFPDSKVHGANMGSTWVLSVPDGPHVGPMNLAIRVAAGSVEDKPGEPTRIKDCLKHKIYIYMFSWTILMLKPKLYTGRTRSLAWLITISSQGWWRHQWRHLPHSWPFVRGILRSPVNSPHRGQWRGALKFSLICPWTNGWVNNRDAGDLRRHRAHYGVIVMRYCLCRMVHFLEMIENARIYFMFRKINSARQWFIPAD